MTLVTCAECGRRAHKKDGMVVTFRGVAYCQNEAECEARRDARFEASAVRSDWRREHGMGATS